MVKNLPAMRETQVQSLGQKEPLEKEMATHSSILAWRIPWTEEPGELQSMGSQRVRHDWAANTPLRKQELCPQMAFGLQLHHQHFLGLQGACLTADFGLASLYNCMSQFLQISSVSLCICLCLSVSTHTYTHTHNTTHLIGLVSLKDSDWHTLKAQI